MPTGKHRAPRTPGDSRFEIELTQTVRYTTTLDRDQVIQVLAGDDELLAMKYLRAPAETLGVALIAAHDRDGREAAHLRALLLDDVEVTAEDFTTAVEVPCWEDTRG